MAEQRKPRYTIRTGNPKSIIVRESRNKESNMEPVKVLDLNELTKEIEKEFNNNGGEKLDDLEFKKVPSYTREELIKDIELLKSSSGCESLSEYKQKIASKEIANFSHANIKMWEELERLLQELEDIE